MVKSCFGSGFGLYGGSSMDLEWVWIWKKYNESGMDYKILDLYRVWIWIGDPITALSHCIHSVKKRVTVFYSVKPFSSVGMKMYANAGPLTNFEVYDFLQKKGAKFNPAQQVMTKLQQTELKVFDYLFQTPACNQTRESITEFTEKSKEFNLAKAELVDIINIRPIDPVEAAPLKNSQRKLPGVVQSSSLIAANLLKKVCIEEYAERMDAERLEELQTMINTILPPRPVPQMCEEANMDAS
ncbi:hypothetical protein KSS87_020577 [Heliosperma pusillum]|nr:hypothetical protein KSS87_020577 [Heliosperma pusillum]